MKEVDCDAAIVPTLVATTPVLADKVILIELVTEVVLATRTSKFY